MIRWHALFALCLVLFGRATRTSAQEQSSAVPYVFLIDTSFSMARHKTALIQTVSALIQTGFNSRMRAGERFSIWTFNEQLYDNGFPAQTWLPDQADALARRATQFLKSQRFEKQTRLDRAVVALRNAVQSSSSVTVVLFTDGDATLAGTPFDRPINEIYLQHRKEVRRTRRVLLTTFTGRDGQLLSWSVGMSREVGGALTSVSPATPARPPETAAAPPQPPAQSETAGPPPSPTNPPPVDEVQPAAAIPASATNAPSTASRTPERPEPERSAITLVVTTPAVVPQTVSQAPPAPNTIEPAAIPESTPDPEPAKISVTATAVLPANAVNTVEPAAVVSNSTAAVIPDAHSLPVATTDASAHPVAFLAAGLLLLVFAVSLLVWLVRPNRSPQPSLISRSIDQHKMR